MPSAGPVADSSIRECALVDATSVAIFDARKHRER